MIQLYACSTVALHGEADSSEGLPRLVCDIPALQTAVGQVGQVEALPGTAPYHLREQPAMLNALHILAILAFTSAPAQRLPLLPGPRPLAPR